MKFSIDILNELKEISPLLAGIEKANIFSVPDNYFNSLPAIVLKNISNKTLPSSLNEEKMSQVPEGYFENLSSKILQRIKERESETVLDELKFLSPVLFSLQNKNVFTVPSEYFKNSEAEIVKKTKPAAKVITIKKRNSAWRIAAAAVVTGFIAITSLQISQKSVLSNKYDQVIPSYPEVKTVDVSEGISKLSDDEIIKYLETTSTASDNEALTSNIEEKELPAPQEYLQDEKTLDNYLNNIDNSSSQN